jgi:hypothetical protein
VSDLLRASAGASGAAPRAPPTCAPRRRLPPPARAQASPRCARGRCAKWCARRTSRAASA